MDLVRRFIASIDTTFGPAKRMPHPNIRKSNWRLWRYFEKAVNRVILRWLLFLLANAVGCKMIGSTPFNTADYFDLVLVQEADVMEGHAVRRRLPSANSMSRDLELSAVPHYAWANRRPGTVQIWLPCL